MSSLSLDLSLFSTSFPLVLKEANEKFRKAVDEKKKVSSAVPH